MSRLGISLFALVVCASQPVHADRRRGNDRLEELKAQFRSLELRSQTIAIPLAERVEVLRQIAEIGDEGAVRFLLQVGRNVRHEDLLGEVLTMIGEIAPDSQEVADLFRRHLGPRDSHRSIARKFLLARAEKMHDDKGLREVFDTGITEDRFLALAAMGRAGSKRTLPSAWDLLRDRSWEPAEKGPVHCGTIAASLERFEGVEASKLLLLLEGDARFRPADAEAVRDATRLWSRRSLRAYIDMAELADPDPKRRAESARFMGEAGIEAARAPLLHLARNPREDPEVRAAAAKALGGLRIARADLAWQLSGLLGDPDPTVRKGAIAGLGGLKVREAAEILAELVGTELDLAARAALARATGIRGEQDWKAWLARPDCPLPGGT